MRVIQRWEQLRRERIARRDYHGWWYRNRRWVMVVFWLALLLLLLLVARLSGTDFAPGV